jgi:hypothetical protein
MAAGTAKWFTRKSRSKPDTTVSRRRVIRVRAVALSDRAEHAVSGAAAERAELRCAGCGYGIVVSGPVPLCPMCRTSDWENPDDVVSGVTPARAS